MVFILSQIELAIGFLSQFLQQKNRSRQANHRNIDFGFSESLYCFVDVTWVAIGQGTEQNQNVLVRILRDLLEVIQSQVQGVLQRGIAF